MEKHFKEKLIILVREYEADAETELAREAREIEEAIANGNILIIILSLVTLFFTILLGFFISHFICKPIIKLKEAMLKVKQEELATRVHTESKDEVGMLANAFNQMLE